MVQGISTVHVSNAKRDRRRNSNLSVDRSEFNVFSNSNSNSEKTSGRGSHENSSASNSARNSHTSLEDNPMRGLGGNSNIGDIRHWLFIEQNGGDILVSTHTRMRTCFACFRFIIMFFS